MSFINLIKKSSPTVLDAPDRPRLGALTKPFGALGQELYQLLSLSNGIFLFNQCLQIFHAAPDVAGNLFEWNEESLWKKDFGGDFPKGLLVFAQDMFGTQFAISTSGVVRIHTDPLRSENFGIDLNEWAERVSSNPDEYAGERIGYWWQQKNRPLARNERLTSKLPLVLGGNLDVENIAAIDMVELQRYRGYIHTQIRDLPDGAKVKLIPIDG